MSFAPWLSEDTPKLEVTEIGGESEVEPPLKGISVPFEGQIGRRLFAAIFQP